MNRSKTKVTKPGVLSGVVFNNPVASARFEARYWLFVPHTVIYDLVSRNCLD
jgi:hypothetical protein